MTYLYTAKGWMFSSDRADIRYIVVRYYKYNFSDVFTSRIFSKHKSYKRAEVKVDRMERLVESGKLTLTEGYFEILPVKIERTI